MSHSELNWAIQRVSHCARAYVDNILVKSMFSTDIKIGLIKQNFYNFCCVLQAFEIGKLPVKGEKFLLFKTVIKFSGHLLIQGKRRAESSELTAMS